MPARREPSAGFLHRLGPAARLGKGRCALLGSIVAVAGTSALACAEPGDSAQPLPAATPTLELEHAGEKGARSGSQASSTGDRLVLWVDGTHGDDDADGRLARRALRTIGRYEWGVAAEHAAAEEQGDCACTLGPGARGTRMRADAAMLVLGLAAAGARRRRAVRR